MELEEISIEVGMRMRRRGFMLATAESCTGGWVGEVLTAIPGSSAWFDRGFITYSNLAKREMLGVNPDVLLKHGAVSIETAKEMAEGALRHSRADVSLAITGIAGPTGGSDDKPVGTVCFAWAMKDGKHRTSKMHFDGSRREIRRQAVETALRVLIDMLG